MHREMYVCSRPPSVAVMFAHNMDNKLAMQEDFVEAISAALGTSMVGLPRFGARENQL